MGWHGRLDLHYLHGNGRTHCRDRHEGPLRVLASLHPEGPAVCHQVMVHPPGGVVGGDVLDIGVEVAAQAHALITTPGATRFYRSAGEEAAQTLEARVADGARLEWLPLETIVHSGTLARNRLRFELAPAAEMIGWDVLALGLPAAGEAFDAGCYAQEIELPGVWLERMRLDTQDPATPQLLHSPLGWDGRTVLATLWFASGSAIAPERRERLLESARRCCAESPLAHRAGVTSPDGRLVVMRALAERTEPALQLLTRVWAAWREQAWQRTACPPRIWGT